MDQATAQIDEFLRQQLDAYSCASPLRDAMAYALLGGGKRVRPTLCLSSCIATGGDPSAALHAAAAVEMIHAFSLVHDDLPALDNDDLRRGRATLHKAKGEAMAILAGDALQSFAIETAFASPVAPSEIAHAVLRAVAAMIDGQVLDTLNIPIEGCDPESTLRTIHHRKTGALLECSCRVGGLAARADEAALEALSTYGRAIGLMFQIVDDLLDQSQSTEHLGKTAGKDTQLGRMTFVSVLGEEASRLRVLELESEAIAAASEFGDLGEDLLKFAQSLAVRTR